MMRKQESPCTNKPLKLFCLTDHSLFVMNSLILFFLLYSHNTPFKNKKFKLKIFFYRSHLPPDEEHFPQHQPPRRHREDRPEYQHPGHLGRTLEQEHSRLAE